MNDVGARAGALSAYSSADLALGGLETGISGRPAPDGASRAMDLAICAVALLLVMPIMLGVALVVLITDGGPVVFAHRRIGRGGREFDCYKFRSMVKDSQQRLQALLASDPEARAEWNATHKLREDPRVTRIGRFIRKYSLDELPQVFNVLKGDMSFVGPRPIVRAEAAYYGRYFSHYCACRPGITGLWQISGRSDTDYKRRVVLDVAYCRSKSLYLDLRIIVMTVPAILMSRGAY